MGCTSTKTTQVEQHATPGAKAVGQKEVEGSTVGDQPDRQEFIITVNKPADSEDIHGLIFQFPDQSSCQVAEIRDGYIKRYNNTQQDTPDAQIQVGDIIVHVNGVSGDICKMLQEVGNQCLELKVQRFLKPVGGDALAPSSQDDPSRSEEPLPADEPSPANEPLQADEPARTEETSPVDEPTRPENEEVVVDAVLVPTEATPVTGTDTVGGDVQALPLASTDGLVDVTPNADELAPPSKDAKVCCSCW
jgi:hypothetical protein